MSSNYSIVEHSSQYNDAFLSLNKWWIDKYFTMEDEDYKMLGDPQKHVIGKGGYILYVVGDSKTIGTCALKKETPDYYELSKMAIHPDYHGQGHGWTLAQAIIKKARDLGAKTLFLESNTILVPAINMYRKLGFVEVPMIPSTYCRCNIRMELEL